MQFISKFQVLNTLAHAKNVWKNLMKYVLNETKLFKLDFWIIIVRCEGMFHENILFLVILFISDFLLHFACIQLVVARYVCFC